MKSAIKSILKDSDLLKIIQKRYLIKDAYLKWRSKNLDNFIFIHINKTAGTSVGAALNLPLEHMTAQQKIEELGREEWDKRFTFAIVRNPWGKVFSHYKYRVKTNQTGLGDGHLPFQDWVRLAYRDQDRRYYNSNRKEMFSPQVDWLTDKEGEICVNYIGRFEALQESFAEISKSLGKQLTLPHKKSSGGSKNYQSFYDDETAEIIRQIFAKDIELFGYSFSGEKQDDPQYKE